MNKQTQQLIVISMMFSIVFGQVKLLNESINDFNGALTIQPKLSVENQKQIRQIETDPTTSNSSSIFWVEPRIREDYQPAEVLNPERISEDWCGTMPWWESRNNSQRSCDLYGVTDDPTVRDSYIPDTNTDIKYFRLFIHAFADDNGDNPTSTLANAEAQLLTLNEAFSDYKIQFTALFQIHNDSQYQSIGSAEWSAGVFKVLYAEDPTTYHNLYVMDTDASWSIMGVSTFPWDSESLTIYGGTIMDKDWFGGPRTYNGQENVTYNIITHELGHALGLWHTHHGVSEVTVCGSCYEGADGYIYATGDNADVVGDLCSDTKGTPMNFNCADPDTFDCQGNVWVDTDYHNFMGYSYDPCYDTDNDGFSSQQSGRVHGWITDKYEGLLVSSEEMTLLSVSFEDGMPNDWTVYDVDANGYSWFAGIESSSYDLAHYGVKGMAVLYNASGNDDWLITPSITVPQNLQSSTLTFWARSHSSTWLEDFNVKLSTSGNSISDFTVTLGSATDVSSSWTEYSYDISAYGGESIYLALQCVSVNDFYLFADDFTVTASLNALPLDTEFSASFTSGYAPLSINFTDLSTGSPTNWAWEFGDGNTSSEQNPTHIYENPGLYTVTLSVSDGTDSDTETKADYINVSSTEGLLLSESFETELPSDWTVIDNDADGNQWARFTDDGHDGGISMGVQYNSSGNDDWLITPQLTLTGNSSIAFSFWARSLSASWLEDFNVKLSTTGNAVSDFTATLESVTSTPYGWTEYTYDLSSYSGQSIYLAVQCVSVDQFYLFVDDFAVYSDPQLIADFIASDSTGEAPLTLQFTDQSWGNPASWSWDFGDGGSSTVQNPSYTFQTPGIYDVSLTISKGTETDMLTLSNYVTVTAPNYSGPVFQVTTTGSDVLGNGSVDYPFATIQTAIDATTNGDTVLVSPGTYVENINYNGKNIVVGSLYMTTRDTSYISSTIIDGNQNGSVVTFGNGEISTALLTGFTIQNGTGGGPYGTDGGGILCYSSSNPSLNNLRIQNNTSQRGGGICCLDAEPIINNSIISTNTATLYGGGIYSSYKNPVLSNIIIVKNTGDGFYGRYSNQPELTNVTIADNIGNGIYCENNSGPTLKNSILWSNTLSEINIATGSVTTTYSCIQGGYSGTGNIDADPLFADTANGDYSLLDYSPAIGTGTATGAPATDIDGNIRPNPAGSNPDMGAYENALGAPIEYIDVSSETLMVTEDSSAAVDLQDNDLVLNVSTLVLTIIDSSSHGTLAIAGDTMLTYTPIADFFGFDTVQYVLSGSTAADTGFVFITVLNEDDLPVVINPISDLTVNEDAPDSLIADLDVVFMDIDDELEYSHVIGDSTLVFASVINDLVTLQFLPNANGSTDIIFTATNPTIRASVSDTMTVTIMPVNDAPVIIDMNIELEEDGNIEILLSGSDVDGDSLSFAVIDMPINGTYIDSIYTPNLNFTGTDSFTYLANDGLVESDTATVFITITNTNDAPFVYQPMDDVTLDEDADTLALLIDGVFDDIDILYGDTLTITAQSLNDDLITIGSNTNEVPYMVFVPDANGETDVVVTATDLAGLSVNDTINVTVNAVNDAPSGFALQSVTSLIMSSSELSTGTISFSWGESSDVDGDTVMYHFTGTLSVGTHSVQYDTTVTDTNYSLISYQSLYDLMFSLNTMTATVEWNVISDDGEVTVSSNNGPLTLSIDGSSLSIEENLVPEVFALHQNYPNPFNPTTTLRYDLPEDSKVSLIIYDIMGREVKRLVNKTQDAGFKSAIWDATNDSGQPVSAGVYLYTIQAGTFSKTNKMVLLK